jgi:[ribosomal protein S5]-alanine N-acetyltransferase
MKLEEIFSDLPILETNRTILRKVKKEDETDMFSYCSDENVSKHTTWYKHNAIEDTRIFINRILEEYRNHQAAPWGIEDKETGKFIGTSGFVSWNTVHSRAEIAYAISKEFWNRGYMTEIVRRIIEFGFEDMGLVRIEARCLLDNIGSACVMEKSQMQLEGILRKQMYIKGQYKDLKIYSIIKEL